MKITLTPKQEKWMRNFALNGGKMNAQPLRGTAALDSTGAALMRKGLIQLSADGLEFMEVSA